MGIMLRGGSRIWGGCGGRLGQVGQWLTPRKRGIGLLAGIFNHLRFEAYGSAPGWDTTGVGRSLWAAVISLRPPPGVGNRLGTLAGQVEKSSLWAGQGDSPRLGTSGPANFSALTLVGHEPWDDSAAGPQPGDSGDWQARVGFGPPSVSYGGAVEGKHGPSRARTGGAKGVLLPGRHRRVFVFFARDWAGTTTHGAV